MANDKSELEALKEKYENEEEANEELRRQLTKSDIDLNNWKHRFENEAVVKTNGLEDTKKKLMSKLSEAEENFEGLLGVVCLLARTFCLAG